MGLRGTAIPLGAQLALLAQIADVFHSAGGPDAAREEVAGRAGTWFSPELVRAFSFMARQTGFWSALTDPRLESLVRQFEPEEGRSAVDEDYLDDIAAGFGAVIDAKSPYTGGHSERVGHYAAALGEKIGFASVELRGLRRAAMLHDVGKLAISSRILEKPGKLDDHEWQEMRSHAEHTRDILSRIGPLREMAMVAASHHERLDGRGYPLGLDRTQIPPEARVITICDFYDALTADRPYRAAMSHGQALEVMGSEAGKALDADYFAALKDLDCVR